MTRWQKMPPNFVEFRKKEQNMEICQEGRVVPWTDIAENFLYITFTLHQEIIFQIHHKVLVLIILFQDEA